MFADYSERDWVRLILLLQDHLESERTLSWPMMRGIRQQVEARIAAIQEALDRGEFRPEPEDGAPEPDGLMRLPPPSYLPRPENLEAEVEKALLEGLARREDRRRTELVQHLYAGLIFWRRPRKRCGRCGQTLSAVSFHREASRKDGLQRWCKRCRQVYYAEHPTAFAAYSRTWLSKR